MSLTTIIVNDANTHVPIPGASVFINGVGQGATGSNGQLVLQLSSGTYSLGIKAAQYTTFVDVIASGSIFTANMLSIAPTIVVDFGLNLYPEDGTSGATVIFSNNGNPISVPYKAGGIVVNGLTPTTQTVTGSIAGYLDFSQTFDATQVTRGTINLTVSSDTGLSQSQQTQASQDPNVASILPTLTPEDIPEFTAPNTGQGTYFTMTQARMYIGGLFIDELNGLQFALQDNKIPIYGYASRFYDTIAQGKSLVQGQFTINFVSEGYLTTALRYYASTVDTGTDVISAVTQQQQARLLTLTNQLQNPDPAWTPDMIKAAKEEIQNLAANLGPDAVTAAKAGIAANVRSQNNSILGLAGGDYPNAIYEDTPFDIVIQYTGAGRSIVRRLEDCRLISNESIMDHSGTPILDSYGFIARRLR